MHSDRRALADEVTAVELGVCLETRRELHASIAPLKKNVGGVDLEDPDQEE